ERDYERESNGAITRKELAAIPQQDVRTFNRDYDRLIDEELSARAARFLEMAREAEFEVVRHVMARANQNYGGALASGDEIAIQLLRPDHMEMGVAVATGTADSWLFTWTATGDQDLFGTTANPINPQDNANAEAILIVGWTTNHPSPKTEAVQATKFGRDLFVQPLGWDLVAAERDNVKVIEANPWFLGLPGETFEIDVNVFVTGADVLRALGVWCGIGTDARDVTFSR
ncbi:MAG: hypothetical protein ACE5Q6_24375, partial [Dehalococcoidia bacterium]